MNKQQCYLFSALSIALALTFSFPLAMTFKPIIGIIFSSALIGIGGTFFLIGVNKWTLKINVGLTCGYIKFGL